MEEVILGGGAENRGNVIRVGNTVRRPRRSGHAVVEALLVHLEAVGFDGAPRFLGVDEQGRQVLEYLEGVASDPTPWQSDDEENAVQLGRVAALLRQLHDATVTFSAPVEQLPRRPLPTTGTVWTHGDVGYSNIVYRDASIRGLIDWEFSAPAHRCNDLAGLLAMAVRAPRLGAADNARRERATRLALDSIASGYGLSESDRIALPQVAATVIDDAVEFWHESGAQDATDAWVWRAAWFRRSASHLVGGSDAS